MCTKPICFAQPVSRQEMNLEYGCNLTKTIYDVFVHVTIFYRLNNVYQQFPIDSKESLCTYLKYKDRRTPVLYEINLSAFLHDSPILLKCPWEPGYKSIEKLNLRQHKIPKGMIALPFGDYRLGIVLTSINEVLTNMTAYIRLYGTAINKRVSRRKN